MSWQYLEKMKGSTASPPRVSLSEILWSWIGAFIGIGIVAFLNAGLLDRTGLLLLVGSFGASAVLLYGAIKSPLAQPRNVFGGHVLSACIGVLSYRVFGPHEWFAAAFAVATAIACMHLTRTLHPPGGATALIAVIGGDKVHSLGYLYVITPIGLGIAIMILAALVVNNIPRSRRYPEFWF